VTQPFLEKARLEWCHWKRKLSVNISEEHSSSLGYAID
jgi:hypothetical protein